MLHPMIQIRYQFVKIYLLLMSETETAKNAETSENAKTEAALLAEIAVINDSAHLFNRQTVHTRYSNGLADFFGEASHLTTQVERNSFGIGTDDNVKALVERSMGRWPNDIFLRDPTRWRQSFALYGWEQTTTRLRPIRVRLLNVREQAEMVYDQEFTNSTSQPGQVTINLTTSVSNTTGITWSRSNTTELGASVSVGADLSVVSTQMTVSTSFSNTYGQEQFISRQITLSVSSGMALPIKAHSTLIGEIHATLGTARFEITYEARLAGRVFVNYNPSHNNHHFWGPQMANLLRDSNKSNSIFITQIAEVGNYGRARLIVREKK